MDTQALEKHQRKVISQRNIFLVFSFLLLFSVVLLLFLLTKKETRTVFIPANGQTFWVEDAQVSRSYLENMGTYVSELLLNRSSESARLRNNALYPHVDPSFIGTLKKALQEDQKTLQAQEQSYVFYPEALTSDLEKLTIWIDGDLMTFAAKSGNLPKIADKTKRRYRLNFKCQAGRLFLTDFTKENLS
ncbi:MAG: type IV conjugative transfer system protein TraE [Chlamydiia bacterium]|nr:type IV conjugative transfer system protein TraE [Chlamydiia bacterium]